jgi:hypothetical protein
LLRYAANPVVEKRIEANIEILMLQWCEQNNITLVEEFLDYKGLVPQYADVQRHPDRIVFYGRKFSVLISLYCAPGENFSLKNFQTQLMAFGVSAWTVAELYSAMNELRREFEPAMTEGRGADTHITPLQMAPLDGPVAMSSASSASLDRLINSD